MSTPETSLLTYLRIRMREYSKQTIGLAFFLGWLYFSFFSCGLVPILRMLRCSERFWSWTGLAVALTACVALVIAVHKSMHLSTWFARMAALAASAGSLLIYVSFYSPTLYSVVSSIGGIIAGTGMLMMLLVWVQHMSRLNEELIEFSVPASFTLAFLIYFILLLFKGQLSALVDICLPLCSMWFACRTSGSQVSESSGLTPELSDHAAPLFIEKVRPSHDEVRSAFRCIGSFALLIMLIWIQISYFRLLSTPDVVGDRFMHYLIPFTCSSLLSLIAFIFCIRVSRFLDFTLVFRWGIPLMLISYGVLYLETGDFGINRILAYTINFIGMFGVQLGCWIAIPKYIRRTRTSAFLVGCIIFAAEGLGIFLGTRLGLTLVDGVLHVNEMKLTLALFMLLVCATMLLGFNPEWSFYRRGRRVVRVSPRDEEYAGPSVGEQESLQPVPANMIALLCEQQAEILRLKFNLSSRETDIAALLLAGHSRSYIRDELVISLNTVHTHVGNIYKKCGVHSQREFMALIDTVLTTQENSSGNA